MSRKRTIRFTLVVAVCLSGVTLYSIRGDEKPSGAAIPTPEPTLQKARDLTARGDELSQRGVWAEAAEAYREALRQFPDDRSVQFRLALCLANGKDTATAIELFRQIANAKAADAKLVTESVAWLEELMFPKLTNKLEEQLELGTAFLQKAANLKSGDSEYKTVLTKSIAELEQVVREFPTYTPAYQSLGLAYELLGDTRKAITAYETYLLGYGKLKVPLSQPARDVRARTKLLVQRGDGTETAAVPRKEVQAAFDKQFGNVRARGAEGALKVEIRWGEMVTRAHLDRLDELARVLAKNNCEVGYYAHYSAILDDKLRLNGADTVVFVGFADDVAENRIEKVVGDALGAKTHTFFWLVPDDVPVFIRSFTRNGPLKSRGKDGPDKTVFRYGTDLTADFAEFARLVRSENKDKEQWVTEWADEVSDRPLLANYLAWQWNAATVKDPLQTEVPFPTRERLVQSVMPVAVGDKLLTQAIDAQSLGDHAEAIRLYRKLLRYFPANAAIRWRLAKCYTAIQSPEKALPHFRLVANTHEVDEQRKAEACEAAVLAACKPLTKEQAQKFDEAVAKLDAARQMRERQGHRLWNSNVKPDDRESHTETRYTKMGLAIQDRVSGAAGMLETLLKEREDYLPLYPLLGQALQLEMEVIYGAEFPGDRAERAHKAYEHYISKHRELGLPNSTPFADIVRRSKEVEKKW